MKHLFYIFVIIALIAIGYFIRLNIEPGPKVITEKEFIEKEIENPVNKSLLLKAKILTDSLDILKSEIAEIKKINESASNIDVVTKIVETDTLILNRDRSFIAETKFDFDNYHAKIRYFHPERQFQFDYEKFKEEYVEITVEKKKRFLRFGLYGMYYTDSSFATGIVFNFEKWLQPLYLTIGADSDKNLSAGLQILF